jgi:hypothetical protein
LIMSILKVFNTKAFMSKKLYYCQLSKTISNQCIIFKSRIT